MHILSFIKSYVIVFRNEEEILTLLVHSSFRRIATRISRRIFVLTFSGSDIREAELKSGVKTDSLRIQYSNTAQLSDWNECDVTRLVSTEDVGNL